MRSLRFACAASLGPAGADASSRKPAGSPRFRNTIRVPPDGVTRQLYVVSIGKGPSAVLITNRSLGSSSLTIGVGVREPTASGGAVFHSTAVMFEYFFARGAAATAGARLPRREPFD
jgi:hypothetical protein